MRTFQEIHLIGRLGVDPDTRYTAEGQAMTIFSVATDRPAKPGTEPDVDWHRVVCFQQQAEFVAKYLAKGRLVFIAGRLSYRSWESKDGQKHRTAEIVASQVIPLDRRPEPELRVVEAEVGEDGLPS